MKVHDRGTMKWTSLMLPEHVEELREVFKEYKAKPLLDEQKRIEIDQALKDALAYQIMIKLTYYEGKDFHTLYSKLDSVDQQQGCIVLAGESGTRILLNDIVDAELL